MIKYNETYKTRKNACCLPTSKYATARNYMTINDKYILFILLLFTNNTYASFKGYYYHHSSQQVGFVNNKQELASP